MDLLNALEATLSEEKLEELLRNQLLEKVKHYRNGIEEGSLNDRIKRLIELRKKEGYLAECQKDKDGEG